MEIARTPAICTRPCLQRSHGVKGFVRPACFMQQHVSPSVSDVWVSAFGQAAFLPSAEGLSLKPCCLKNSTAHAMP